MKLLLDGVTANGDSATLSVGRAYRGDYRVAKVNIVGGTATVTLFGRAAPNDPVWTQIAEFTASGATGILAMPQMKFTVSGISGATVRAWVDAFEA